MIILSLIAPTFFGLTILVRCLINKGHLNKWMLVFALLPGTGIAITSVLHFLYFSFLRPHVSFTIYAVFEIFTGLTLFVATMFWIRRQRRSIFVMKSGCLLINDRKSAFLSILIFIVFVVFTANVLDDWYSQTLNSPHGNWDAWAIWNLRAKFIYSTEYWKNGFSSLISWSHPDYPLLIPSFIAREWFYFGRLSWAVPAITGLVFLSSVVFVLVTGVGIIHGLSVGALAGLFALGIVLYSLKYLQYADLPLAFYFIAANLSYFLSETKYQGKPQLNFLVGFFIGAALWTKNEGFAFFMAIIVSEVINVLSSPHGFSAQIKRWLFISYGCLPFIVSVILLKTTLAPSNDLIIGTTINEIINKIFDPARFMMIGNHFFKQIIAPWSFRVPLVLLLIFYLLTVGLDKNKVLNRGIKMFGMRLGLTASFYFVVYLITPRPLEWHLNSSVDRLFMQLLPSFILFIFLAAKNPFFVENTNL